MTDRKVTFGPKAEFKRPNTVSICFQCCNDRSGKPAMNVDFAPNVNNQSIWQQKQTIQLSIDELSMLVAMFLKLNDNCNFAYHGPMKSNSLVAKRISNVEGVDTQFNVSLFIKGTQSGFIFLTKSEAFRVFKLALKQLTLYYEQSESEVIITIEKFYG
ncbi:hypothetical protein [Thalassotalea piscium]|uniref:Uncharacterized protein n=1 Tax=Thalassotalea piscium TaxID=1230533 RepID=A0A7X0TVC7_9GAMM|nr:hypothetical protein [Thalassotalea piscium]MBB6545128.1 hypothetical protein [Thalassotalea piscium]